VKAPTILQISTFISNEITWQTPLSLRKLLGVIRLSRPLVKHLVQGCRQELLELIEIWAWQVIVIEAVAVRGKQLKLLEI